MKKYLTDYFNYNDKANRKYFPVIRELKEKGEAVMFFSHLITSQNKWMNRITKMISDSELQWFAPVFDPDELEQKWEESVGTWIEFLAISTEKDLNEYVYFNRPSDNKPLKVKLKDIVFQLNCHSVHHRAQIARIIREQGIQPPATDYIHSMILPAEDEK